MKPPVQTLSALHESASLRAVTGPALRPGGFHLTERGLSLCGFGAGARIVDVGCGTGASVAFLREKHRFKALGVDVSDDLFQRYGNAGTIPLAIARAEELPLPNGSCDGVLCECVLSLVTEPERVAGEFSRILRPGGFLILSDIYDRTPGDCPPDGSGCIAGRCSTLRSRPFVERLLAGSGFGLVAWEDHTRYLRELAAQLVLNSDSPAEFHNLFRVRDSGCACPPGSEHTRPGYYLLVAQK